MDLRLETERLVLRRLEPADAADLQRWAGDRRIADTTLRIPHPYPDGAAEAWIEETRQAFDAGREVALAITLKPGGELIGVTSLLDIEAGFKAEIGYWIGVPWWGRGFATEAGRAMVRYAFAELGLVRVHAHLFTRNAASGRVLQKMGLRHEGSFRQHVRNGDRIEDIEFYGILATDPGAPSD